jgi:hypothetical protein
VRESSLQRAAQQHCAESRKENCRDIAKPFGIEPDGKPHGRGEQSHGGERKCEADGERHRAEGMRGHGRADDNGYERQYARRKDRQRTGE